VVASITLALCLLFLTGLVENLPKAVLAAVVLTAILGLFVLGRALEGSVEFVGPNALEVRFAPGRFQRWGWRGGGTHRALS
jgi:hypothetical protein